MSEAAIITAGVGVASTLMSNREQERANQAERRAQKRANQIEQRRSAIANQRERRQAAQQSLNVIASNEAAAMGFGGGGIGSALQGANTAIMSNFGSAVGYQNTMLAAGVARSNVLQRGADQSARYMNRAANYNALAGIAGTALPYTIPK